VRATGHALGDLFVTRDVPSNRAVVVELHMRGEHVTEAVDVRADARRERLKNLHAVSRPRPAIAGKQRG